MTDRMIALLSGDAQPESDWDRMILNEMLSISARGFIHVPSDLPDPIDDEQYRAALDLGETMSSKGLPGRIGRARNAVFDPNAQDGDGDLRVQDDTPFERPAPPRQPKRVTAAVRRVLGRGEPIPKPSESRATERETTPLRRRLPLGRRSGPQWVAGGPGIELTGSLNGARNTVIDPHLPNPQEQQQVINRLKTMQNAKTNEKGRAEALKKLRDYGAKWFPFGLHRGPEDGPHPAAQQMVERYSSLAEKYGELKTVDQMESALRKAFPGADVSLVAGFRYEGIEEGNIRKRTRFRSDDVVKALVDRHGLSAEEAAKVREEILRHYTTTLLGLREEYPDTAKRLRSIGLIHSDENRDESAYLMQSEFDPTQNNLMLNPLQVYAGYLASKDTEQMATWDLVAMLNLVSSQNPSGPNLGTIVSDSDLAAHTATTITHEWGHLRGSEHVEKALTNLGLGPEELRKILFADGDVPTVQDLIAKGLTPSQASEIRKLVKPYRSFKKPANKMVEALAKDKHLLWKRLKESGKKIDEDAVKSMSESERLALAAPLIQNQLLGTVMFDLHDALAQFGNFRDRDENPMIRMIGNYASSHPEEAAAEGFLAAAMGLDTTTVISPTDDFFHSRRKKPS